MGIQPTVGTFEENVARCADDTNFSEHDQRPDTRRRQVPSAETARESACGFRGKQWRSLCCSADRTDLSRIPALYWCSSVQICQTTKQSLLHGCVVLQNRWRESQLRANLSESWDFQAAVGNFEENVARCADDADFREHGQRPGKRDGGTGGSKKASSERFIEGQQPSSEVVVIHCFTTSYS